MNGNVTIYVRKCLCGRRNLMSDARICWCCGTSLEFARDDGRTRIIMAAVYNEYCIRERNFNRAPLRPEEWMSRMNWEPELVHSYPRPNGHLSFSGSSMSYVWVEESAPISQSHINELDNYTRRG